MVVTEEMEAVTKVVNNSNAIREALEAPRASEESTRMEPDSWWSKATLACGVVLGITLSRAPLITQLGGILGRVERVVADEAFFGVRIVLLVVISHYNGIDLPSVG
jgi:hypothetical protein